MTKKFKELLNAKGPFLKPYTCVAESKGAKQCLARWQNPTLVPGFEPQRALSCPLGTKYWRKGNHDGQKEGGGESNGGI